MSALRAGPLALAASGCVNMLLQPGLLTALPTRPLHCVANEGENRLWWRGA